ALDCASELEPDVVLLDLRLPDMLGPEIVRGIHARAPKAILVIFTAFADHAAISAARSAGASALLLKDASGAEMLELLGRIRAGEELSWSDDPAEVERRRSSALAQLGLTRREYDVLRRVALGETNPEIAEAMNLSRNTVKSYLQSTFSKLGTRNRVEALARAREERRPLCQWPGSPQRVRVRRGRSEWLDGRGARRHSVAGSESAERSC